MDLGLCPATTHETRGQRKEKEETVIALHLTSESCSTDKPCGLILTTMFILSKRTTVLQEAAVRAHTAELRDALQDALHTLFSFYAHSLAQCMKQIPNYELST